MSAKKHIIALSEEERHTLEKVSRSHRHSLREKTRARLLLLADTSRSRAQGGHRTDAEIARQLRCDPVTVYQGRRRAIERGVLASVNHQEQTQRKARVLDGAGEAHLIALACSTPPEGEARWSLRLLRERLIELEVVENIAQETIRRTLKKTLSSRG